MRRPKTTRDRHRQERDIQKKAHAEIQRVLESLHGTVITAAKLRAITRRIDNLRRRIEKARPRPSRNVTPA